MKKVNSILISTFLILCLIPSFILADEGRYYWVKHASWANINTSNSVRTINRMLRERDDVNYFVYKYYNQSNVLINSRIFLISPEFDSSTLANNWKTQYGSYYLNSITNGNLGSQSTLKNDWTLYTYTFNDNTGNHTKYVMALQYDFSFYFYSGLGNTYMYVESQPGVNQNNLIGGMICFYFHGIFASFDINTYCNVFQTNRYYPFVFGTQNQNGDQRNFDDTQTNVNTINIHPEDSFNTYEVNRNTSSNTVSFDTYVLPDAVDINSNVITSNELRYQDYTYNTEFNVANITNYYTGGGEDTPDDNNTGGNGGNGSVNNSGVTISVAENAVNMTQTIEENAVNVTVNNNNSVNQELVNDIENIINTGNPNENTFQQTIQNLSEFVAVGNMFASLVSAFFAFLPGWVLSLIAVTFALLVFMIVLRIIHLFV